MMPAVGEANQQVYMHGGSPEGTDTRSMKNIWRKNTRLRTWKQDNCLKVYEEVRSQDPMEKTRDLYSGKFE